MPENEELDEQSLFDAVVSDEPEVVTEQVENPEAVEKPEVVAEAEAEKPVVDDNAPTVPSWRLREVNDEKRALADRLAAVEAERVNWQKQQPVKEPEKAARPDPLLDPDGYAAAIRQELREEALNDRREESLIRAREANTKEFDEAYQAAQQAVDPALKARMQNSRDPGKTLLEWHRENKTRAEVGNDLTAYKQKLRDEALKDPEFRKAAMEAWRADANPQTPGGRPRVDLPPSLNGASRSNSMLRSGNDDIPDHELWNEITA